MRLYKIKPTLLYFWAYYSTTFSFLFFIMHTQQGKERENILLTYATEMSMETAEIPLEEV